MYVQDGSMQVGKEELLSLVEIDDRETVTPLKLSRITEAVVSVPTYLPTSLPPYPPTYLPTYLPPYLPTVTRSLSDDAVSGWRTDLGQGR